jgi:S-adenosylmethionine hydrolase
MAPVIAMLSDFGHEDPYVGIMKAVVLRTAPEVQFVDLCHRVGAGDILQGALQLRSAMPYFPDGTVFLCVVDPGVGGSRRPIAARTKRFTVVGPDNGLLSLALAQEEVETVVHLTEPRFHLPEVSHTFHGRDVFAPVAAHLARGVAIGELGEVITDYKQIHLPEPDRHNGHIAGVILEIDRFGNLSTNIPRTMLPDGESLNVRIAGHNLAGLCSTYSDVPPGKLLALIGSQDTLEIACRNGSAQDKLGVDRGQTVTITWHS